MKTRRGSRAWKSKISKQTKKAMKSLPESSVRKMSEGGKRSGEMNKDKKCPWLAKRNRKMWRKRKFRKKMSKVCSETMKRLHKDPKFAKEHSERHRKLMTERNKDPKYAKKLDKVRRARKGAMKKKNGYCEICKIHCYTFGDHCHKTGRKRGRLCINCNLGLGYFMDSTKLLRRASKYLKKYRRKKKVEA